MSEFLPVKSIYTGTDVTALGEAQPDDVMLSPGGGIKFPDGSIQVTAPDVSQFVQKSGDTMTGLLRMSLPASPDAYSDLTGAGFAIYNKGVNADAMVALDGYGYGNFRNSDVPTAELSINSRDQDSARVGLVVRGYADNRTILVGNADFTIKTTYASSYINYATLVFGYQLYSDPAASNHVLKINTTGSECYFIYQGGTGNAIANNGNWVSNSDAKNKENVVSLAKDERLGGKALDLISKLNPCAYNRIGVDAVEVGFIAQEVGQVLPNVMVSYTYSDGPAEDGSEPAVIEGVGLNYNGIVAYQAMAIQELNEIVKGLETRLAALEAV